MKNYLSEDLRFQLAMFDADLALSALGGYLAAQDKIDTPRISRGYVEHLKRTGFSSLDRANRQLQLGRFEQIDEAQLIGSAVARVVLGKVSQSDSEG